MATPVKHRDQAEKNEAFAEELLSARSHVEWIPVLAFYAALHYVRAYLSGNAAYKRHLSHDDMFSILSREANLKPALPHYSNLFYRCNEARYDLMVVHMPVAADLVRQDLAEVKRIILPLLSAPSSLD